MDTIASRYRIIRSIFLRLQNASSSSTDAILAVRATRIFNDLFGSDMISDYAAANSFALPPAAGKKTIPVDDGLLLADQEVTARSTNDAHFSLTLAEAN